DVVVEEPLDSFATRDFTPDDLLGFLELMEFKTLTRRVRDSLGMGPASDAAAPAIAAAATSNSITPMKALAIAMGEAPVDETQTGPVNTEAYETITTREQLDRWIARGFAAGVIAVDTETDALSSSHSGLVGISLGLGPNDACYIPLAHRENAPAASANTDLFGEAPQVDAAAASNAIVQIPLSEAIAALKPLLEDPSVLKVGQNIKYDLGIFSRYGVRVAPFDDSMLISYSLEAGLHQHGMDELSELHLKHTPIKFADVCGTGKNQISFDKAPIDAATRYSGEDCDVTLRLWSVLKPRLARESALTVYETIERPLPQVVSDMELAGIKVDRDVLNRLSGEFSQRMGAHEAEAHELAGKPFNLGSPKQIGEILFGDMALPGGKKTATGAWATDVSVMEDLADQGHALPRTILDWRQLSKLKSTYADALRDAADPKTGRVHTSYSLAATQTGRLASTEPNLQNIPVRTEEGRKIREAFVAEPGHVLISADYSQIELRLLAHVANIDALKNAFRDGMDIHAMTASEMFDTPIEGMDPMIRRRAKAINFGIIYGISAWGLARQLSIPQGEASAYIARYFERFPGIRDYMNQTKEFAREHGYVTTIFGRKLHIRDIKSTNQGHRGFAERQAINAPLQGSAADLIKRAMIRLPDALSKAGLKAKMLLQVHDELIFEAPQDEADATCKLTADVMAHAHEPAAQLSIPLTVEARAASNWAAAH
ncbi:MAG: DNA polymerase I, partial [Caulobacterales bacterium]